MPSFPEAIDWQEDLQKWVDLVREDFRKVHHDLRAARESLEEVQPDLPLASLLIQAQNSGTKLLEDMEELLNKIPENTSNSQGGGDPQDSSEPSDQPKNPDQKPGEEPKQPKPSEQEQEDGEQSTKPLQGRFLFDHRSGSWGDLPPRLQHALQNAAIEDLPLRYRHWLDEYHRKRVK
jgi:hypothetical protein